MPNAAPNHNVEFGRKAFGRHNARPTTLLEDAQNLVKLARKRWADGQSFEVTRYTKGRPDLFALAKPLLHEAQREFQAEQQTTLGPDLTDALKSLADARTARRWEELGYTPHLVWRHLSPEAWGHVAVLMCRDIVTDDLF